ncbi:MAG: LicD family protein [Selenomonadaceae bacterium]|nr:LicD family protein [Selenomonadaceae bacterium]
MGKGANRLDAITQQNELLKEQNELLREQIELLKNSSAQPKNDGREIFVENIDRDEMRNGFLVTSHRKKLWNVQIGLINEFARICQKHNLRWFPVGGTLLGTVRHKGFVPWDDDVDLAMFRPDYEKLKRVIAEELSGNFSVYLWNNFKLESDELIGIKSDPTLKTIPAEQEKKYPGWQPFFPLMRLIDERTTMLGPDDRQGIFSGIWIDILCFDPVPPFVNRQQKIIFQTAKMLLVSTIYPNFIRKAIEDGKELGVSHEELQKFLNLPYKMRGAQYEKFLLRNFFESERVGYIKDHIYTSHKSYETASFKKVISMPFEKIELPVPVGYDEMLTADYGDWHEMKVYFSHTVDNSADISYVEYFQKAAKKTLVTDENNKQSILIEEKNNS